MKKFKVYLSYSKSIHILYFIKLKKMIKLKTEQIV